MRAHMVPKQRRQHPLNGGCALTKKKIVIVYNVCCFFLTLKFVYSVFILKRTAIDQFWFLKIHSLTMIEHNYRALQQEIANF